MNCSQIDITVDESGKFLAGYIARRKGVVVTTEQHLHGKLAIDYDAQGQLLGIEFLDPTYETMLRELKT